MRRLLYIFIPVLIIVGAVFYINRGPIILTLAARQVEMTSLEARRDLLLPAIQFIAPQEGAPPYPAVIQFHGCAGPRQPFMEQWAQVANEAGFMAVIVDSHKPRGISRKEALKTVCEGKTLLGQERAGDILAALDIVRARTDIDTANVVLAGWSHGAWSIMDLIALDPPRRIPAGIEGDLTLPLDPSGLILVYPYCGWASWTHAIGWRAAPPALALVAGQDTIVNPKECPVLFERLNGAGAGVEVKVYEGVDHVFDDPYLEPQYQYFYDAEAHADATLRYRTFLERIGR